MYSRLVVWSGAALLERLLGLPPDLVLLPLVWLELVQGPGLYKGYGLLPVRQWVCPRARPRSQEKLAPKLLPERLDNSSA
jgi:hypothetical protein